MGGPMRRVATRAPHSDGCVRFERAIMDFLQRRGHLSPLMRPLWEARIVARSMLPERRAHDLHLTALRDCLEMMADWPSDELMRASRYLTRRGAMSIDDLRERLPRK